MKWVLGKGPIDGRKAQERQRVFDSIVVPELNWTPPEPGEEER
jgi:hypothetical protein